MYGKVIAASGGAYLLAFEWDAIPELVGVFVLLAGGSVVLSDIVHDRGPQRRTELFLQRVGDRMSASLQRTADKTAAQQQLKRIAQEELQANHGLVLDMPLKDEDREWLLSQAALAAKKYDAR